MGKQSLEFADMTPYNGNCCPLFLFPLCCTTHIICLAVPLVYELHFAIQVLMVSFTLKAATSSSERTASGLQMATSSISLFNELSSHPFAMKQVQ
jgi:hypothetical protein